ncbi:MAG: lipid-binding protein [Parabacteroides sp.]|nr:lipid-binding protein [Parabacteroides sp.]
MKKYLYIMISALALLTISCEEDTDPGRTSVEEMAGDWWVRYELEDGGEWVDLAGYQRFTTYNTSGNNATEMWINDGAHFWDFSGVVSVDYPNKTFKTNGMIENNSYESQFEIIDGKVLAGKAITPSGQPADSLVFFVKFSDDTDGLTYKVSGFRRTGFPADDFE